MRRKLKRISDLHKAMEATYTKYDYTLKALHNFYIEQVSKNISLPNKPDRFYLKEFQLFVKDFWITNILLLKDGADKWKKANKEKRLKDNIKKQSISPLQQTDNIYRTLVKNKPQIDNLQHGIQFEEFKQALLRICILAEKQFIDFKQSHDAYIASRAKEPHALDWKARYNHGDGNKEADANKVLAFDGLMVYLDIPAGKYGNAGAYSPTKPFIRDKETEKKFRKVLESRRRQLPPRRIKQGKTTILCLISRAAEEAEEVQLEAGRGGGRGRRLGQRQ